MGIRFNRITLCIIATGIIAIWSGSLWPATEAHAHFADIEQHPARETIELWLEEGRISGFEDGTFRPDDTVSRAEFSVLLNRVFEWDALSASSHSASSHSVASHTAASHTAASTFRDVPSGSWFEDAVWRLLASEAIAGYADGTFRPHAPVTRQEAAVIFQRLLVQQGAVGERVGTAAIPDLDRAAAWSREALVFLAESGYIPDDAPFRPADPLTRAETVKLLDRFLIQQAYRQIGKTHAVFSERFQNKTVDGHSVRDAKGELIWTVNETEGQTFAIAPDGSFELGGARYMQRLELKQHQALPEDDMVMEFTVNLQRMGNEGHSGRPMIVIIPRTKDSAYNEYYAVTYFMETTYMGNIVANLFKTKWAIVNTASPHGMEPLAIGHYMLQENVDYTARLIIRHTEEQDVRIEFYIDGPSDPAARYEPVVAYTDDSPHKIMRSAAGPAFGMVGRADDFWGPPPTVRYDDIRIMEWKEYEKLERGLKRFALQQPADLEGHELENEILFLLNKGWMETDAAGRVAPDEQVTVQEFVRMLQKWSGDDMLHTDSGIPLTKAEAAVWIDAALGKRASEEPEAGRYASVLGDLKDVKPEDAVAAMHYMFAHGIMGLEQSGRFEPERKLTRAEAALLLLSLADDGYRLPHGEIQLPSILSSGAVLQRGKPIPIWGTGTSGETITVRFRDQVKRTKVRDGHWYVELDPEHHGGPDVLTISGVAETVKLDSIWVGEVFIVAGQSNAEMAINEVKDTEEIFEKYRNSERLRFYFADQVMAVKPRFDDGGNWNPAYEWAIGYSSAIGTFFANQLLESNPELEQVPIGIIRTTYGGSTIEVFLPHTFFEEIGFQQKHDEPIMSGYWNGFIHTVAPYAAKAVLYYQGENSTQLGHAYESLLREYLSAMREQFRDPELPFFLVQLAGYGENYYETDIDSWPIIREIQMRVANTTPNTELVTAVDLADDDPLEIHPLDKKPIGERLAYRALETLYGDASFRDKRSPEADAITLNDGKYTIGFRHIEGGLVLYDTGRDPGRNGFEIKDEAGSWLPARATLSSDRQHVIVWHDQVDQPQGVRYAWRNYPSVTLFDASGLPALPFHSLVDLNAPLPVIDTDEHYLRVPHHFLKDYDGIVNMTRDDAFRMVEALDGHTLWHEFAIVGQTSGDRIALLARLDNGVAEEGTAERIVRMRDHGLKAGDWVRNNTRGWTASRILQIIDEHTFLLDTAIAGQTAGDELERYQLKRVIEAVGG